MSRRGSTLNILGLLFLNLGRTVLVFLQYLCSDTSVLILAIQVELTEPNMRFKVMNGYGANWTVIHEDNKPRLFAPSFLLQRELIALIPAPFQNYMRPHSLSLCFKGEVKILIGGFSKFNIH